MSRTRPSDQQTFLWFALVLIKPRELALVASIMRLVGSRDNAYL